MPIIFITGYGDVPMSVRAMKAGAVEFLTKPFSDDVLLDAIRALASSAARQRWVRSRRRGRCAMSYASLSRREREVMALGRLGAPEQASRRGARHQRDHGEGTPGQRHAQDEGRLAGRSGENGCEIARRACAQELTFNVQVVLRLSLIRLSRFPLSRLRSIFGTDRRSSNGFVSEPVV